MSTLTRAELAGEVSEALEISRKQAYELVEQFFQTIELALLEGDTVKLSGFGQFEVRDKTARPARNPKTGEPAIVSARKVISYKPSKKLKTRIKT